MKGAHVILRWSCFNRRDSATKKHVKQACLLVGELSVRDKKETGLFLVFDCSKQVCSRSPTARFWINMAAGNDYLQPNNRFFNESADLSI